MANVSPKNKKSPIRLAPKPANSGAQQAAAPQAQAMKSAPQAQAVKPAPKKKKKVVWLRNSFDYSLFTIILILLAFGIVMMFSASYVTAYKNHGDSLFFVRKQLIFALIGIAAMIFISNLDYHYAESKRFIQIAGIGSVVLMLSVFVFGTTLGGAERWIEIAGITFQPSELLKFAVICVFAYLTNKRFEQLKDFKKGFLPFAIILAFSCGLVLLQPHLSGTIIIFAIGVAMMFVAGVSTRHLVVMLVAIAVLIVLGVVAMQAMGITYFNDRIQSFTNPEADITDTTFQTYQSLVTIGSGGFFGLGFGNSRQKYSYLPASENDFIFSIICEELGFVGAIFVILLFGILIFRGFYIASHARDKTGMMLAVGITIQMGLQAFLNIAVATNSVPNTGISLPFFSYGGTALVMQLCEMGVLLNISRKAELE